MTQTVSGGLEFVKAWTFPESVEQRIENFIRKIGGLWLHAPAGISKLAKGPFKYGENTTLWTLDIDESVKPDILCDIYKMKEHPLIHGIMRKYGGFTGVISDPVWLKIETCSNCGHKISGSKGLAYPDRRNLSYAIRDILRPGGWWLFNGLWVPEVKGLKLADPKTNPLSTPVEVPIQNFNSFRNVSLLMYLKKINKTLES
jgi:hypothetical protein